jgi:hypothetical protein
MNQRTIKLSREAVRRYQEDKAGCTSAFPFILIGIETALIIITLSINN